MTARPLRLVLDPMACHGHGLCAELLPELIGVDDWGYPVLGAGTVAPELASAARRAAGACPKLALALQAAAG